MSPVTVTEPAAGRNCPAISRSRVDLPAPLAPISPVRPGPKAALRPDSGTVPSGKEKERSLMTTDMTAPWQVAGTRHRGAALGPTSELHVTLRLPGTGHHRVCGGRPPSRKGISGRGPG